MNLVQTAEGAMAEVTEMLQRMRELAVQAGNSTNTDTDRAAMNDEITQLKSEIDRVAKTTQFNNMNILDGSFAGKLQIGNNAGQSMDIATTSIASTAMGETASGLAKTSTKASLSVAGASTNVADYQGASFNVNINGVTKTVTLPVASAQTVQVSGATKTQQPAVTDAVVDISSKGQIGAVMEKVVNMTTATNGQLTLTVGASGAQAIDISAATYYKTATEATGSEIVAALQTEINKNAFFQGPNAVKVSLTSDGRINLAMASGAAQTITVAADAGGKTFVTAVIGAAGAGGALTNGLNSSSLSVNGRVQDLSNNTAFRVGGQNLDLGAAITANNFKATALSVDQFVKVYNETAKVGGVQLSSASATSDGTVVFSISSPVASTNPLANGNAVTSLAVTATNRSVSFTDATALLGQNTLTITTGTNDVLKISVGGQAAAALTLTPTATTPYTNMQELAAEIQKQANKAFTGADTVTVGAVQDADKRWGLKFSNAAGKAIDLSGTFMDSPAATTKFANNGINFDNSSPASVSVDVASSAPTVKVTTAGAAGVARVAEFSFGNLAKGGTLTIGGATVTAVSDLTGQELAAAFGGKLAAGAFAAVAGKFTVAGTLGTASSGAAAGNKVVFTSAAVNDTNPPVLVTGSTSSINNSSFPSSVGTSAFKVQTVDLSTPVTNLVNVQVNGGTNQLLDLAASITKLGLDKAKLSGDQLVNVLNDTFATAGMVGVNGVTASIDAAGQLSFQAANPQNGSNPSVIVANGTLGGAAGTFVTTITQLGGVAAGNANPAATTTFTSDVAGKAVLRTNATDTEKFGITNLRVAAGTNNVMSVTIGSNPKVNLTATDGTYTDATTLVAELNRQVTASGAFNAGNALSFSVVTDTTGNQGIKATSATGQEVKLSGSMMNSSNITFGANNGGLGLNDFSTTGVTFPAATTATGGINLAAGNAVTLSVTGANGQAVSKSFNLAGTGGNVSFAGYAADLQSAANTAFAGTGYSFSAAAADGKIGFTVNNASAASFSASGSAITSAFGTAINGTAPTQALDVNKFITMADVAKEITKDLGGAAEASFDAVSNSWSFAVKTGDAGVTSSIALSGAGLAAVQMGGALTATGGAGEASAGRLSNANLLTTDAATAALGSIDNSITYVSKQRSLLGAIQNRLEHTVNNLTNIVTNTEASRSSIMDADYSKETTALAKSQILTQAATAMLAQANQSSQGVLSLLK
jgi:flagellin